MIDNIYQNVLPHYLVNAQIAQVRPLGNGHINHTFLIRQNDTQFVLQKINTQVFPTPWQIINNADRIAKHLAKKISENEYQLNAIKPIKTLTNQLALSTNNNEFWRAISFQKNSCSLEMLENTKQAKAAGFAFGHFIKALADLNPINIKPVIADFHHLAKRYDELELAIHTDLFNRKKSCQPWINIALANKELLHELTKLLPLIPSRICHNDTKINNLLFDQQKQQAIAVIDLDTCMPSYCMFDFGDLARSCCATLAEDSTDLDKLSINIDIFQALTQGYLKATSDLLSHQEKQSLWLGTKIMPLMLGIRFLTDYLTGDKYFKINHAQHNLDRAANQLTLHQKFSELETQLKPLITSGIHSS